MSLNVLELGNCCRGMRGLSWELPVPQLDSCIMKMIRFVFSERFRAISKRAELFLNFSELFLKLAELVANDHATLSGWQVDRYSQGDGKEGQEQLRLGKHGGKGVLNQKELESLDLNCGSLWVTGSVLDLCGGGRA